MKCTSINYNMNQMEEFIVYCGNRATGIILTAFFLCCLLVIPSIRLPHKEVLAVSELKPIGNVSSFNLEKANTMDIVDILDAYLQGITIPTSITNGLLQEKREVSSYKTPLTKHSEREVEIAIDKEPVFDKETVIDKEGVIDNGADIPSTVPNPIPALTYSGALRMDYCIGSAIDFQEIEMYCGSEILRREEWDDVTVDMQSPGTKTLEITYGNQKVAIPYGVAEYRVKFHGNGGIVESAEAILYNYQLDMSAIETPRRLGREFKGWYRDADCTIPFTGSEPGEITLDIYAGWQDITDFSCDNNGIITGFNGISEGIMDGVLVLPSHKDFTGIAGNALADLDQGIWEVYIPANITYIEPEVFSGLSELMFIYVDAENPNYYSDSGILYLRDSGIEVARPEGQTM